MKLQEADMLLAGKYLLSCLMGAIDRGMGAKYGPGWFELFKAREKEERVPLITDEKCLEDLDIQACLKLFKFRSEYRDAVLAHFGFYDLGTEAEKKERRNTFTQAVTRLMDNYRNKYMHLRAGEAEGEWSTDLGDGSYGVAEAIGDMKEVSKYFLTVRDSSGVPYYDRICECESSYADDKLRQMYSVSGELSFKGFKGCTGDDFIRACNELNIPVEQGDDGEFYFFSSDHDGDLQEIKRQMSRNRNTGEGRRRKSALITGLAVAGAALAAGLVIAAFAGRGDGGRITGVSAEEFQPREFEAGEIDPEEAKQLLGELKEIAGETGLEDFKQYYTAKYRDDEALDDYIENDRKWLAGAGESFLFVPVVKDENTLGASAVFYTGQTSQTYESLTDGEQPDKGTDVISSTQQGIYSRSRLFTFAYEDGELKVALEKIATISKYTGDYPEGYNSAVAEGRNTYLADEADYSFKDKTAVIPGPETTKCILAWAEPDGSVSLLIRLANGTPEEAQYSSIHVIVMTGTGKSLLYDGDVDLRRNGKPRVLEPGTGVNYIVNIKKDSLTEGAAVCEWGDLRVEVSNKTGL